MRAGSIAQALADHPGVLEHAAATTESGLVLQSELVGAALEAACAPMDVADRRSDAASADPPPGLENLALISRFIQMTVIRREQLRLGELEPLLVASLFASPRRFSRPLVAAARCEQGDRHAAGEQLVLFSDELRGIHTDWIYLATLAIAAETAAEIGFAPLAAPLEERLIEQVPQVVVGSGLIVLGHLDRYLGLVAHLRGDLDLAIERFSSARTSDADNGLRLWSAWAAHGEAASRLGRAREDDRCRASALLDEAAGTAEAFGSKRLAQRVESLRAKDR
jgi:hypothetical protein